MNTAKEKNKNEKNKTPWSTLIALIGWLHKARKIVFDQ